MKHAVAPLAWIIHITTHAKKEGVGVGGVTLQQWIVGTAVWFFLFFFWGARASVLGEWAILIHFDISFFLKRQNLELPGKINKVESEDGATVTRWVERIAGSLHHPSQWHFNDCQISSPVQTHILSLCMNESIWGSHHPAHGRAPSHIHDRETIWKWDTW